MLRGKEKEYGHPIYLISDEPYREIVYDGVQVPFVPHFYDDTHYLLLYSKSLSLPVSVSAMCSYRRQPPTARRCTLRSAVPAAHSVMFMHRVCSSA